MVRVAVVPQLLHERGRQASNTKKYVVRDRSKDDNTS